MDNQIHEELINKLSDYYNTQMNKVYVPSLDEYIKFKPINVEQHNRLSAILDNPFMYPIKFKTYISKIILENIQTHHHLLATDRESILMTLKADLCGEHAVFQIKDDEYEADLIMYAPEIMAIPLNIETVVDGPIEITCKIPTLEEDIAINERIFHYIEHENENHMTKSIGGVYLYEIIKYIKTINLPGLEEPVDFNTMTYERRIEVCNKFTTTTSSKIIEFINKTKSDAEAILNTTDKKGFAFKAPLNISLITAD